MPTYKNKSSLKISILGDISPFGPVVLEPNQTIETIFILDDNVDLERLNDTPFYNPIVDYDEVNVVSGVDQTIEINKNTRYIRILNVDNESVNIYLESKSNTPPIVIPQNNSVTISVGRRFGKLIVSSENSGIIHIYQIANIQEFNIY